MKRLLIAVLCGASLQASANARLKPRATITLDARLQLRATTALDARLRPPATTAVEATRIVSLIPAVTQILFAIGAGPQVVGVSNYDREPAEVGTRTKVGV